MDCLAVVLLQVLDEGFQNIRLLDEPLRIDLPKPQDADAGHLVFSSPSRRDREQREKVAVDPRTTLTEFGTRDERFLEAKYRLGETLAAIPFALVEVLLVAPACPLPFHGRRWRVLFGVVFDEAANRVLRAVISTYEFADGLHDLFEIDMMGGGTWLCVI